MLVFHGFHAMTNFFPEQSGLCLEMRFRRSNTNQSNCRIYLTAKPTKLYRQICLEQQVAYAQPSYDDSVRIQTQVFYCVQDYVDFRKRNLHL